MFKGRKPSRTIKLNIRGGEKFPCPLGVLRGTKDTGACTPIKNISNTVTFDYKYQSIFSHPYFRFVTLNTCSLYSALPCQPLALRNQPKRTQAVVDPTYPS